MKRIEVGNSSTESILRDSVGVNTMQLAMLRNDIHKQSRDDMNYRKAQKRISKQLCMRLYEEKGLGRIIYEQIFEDGN